MSTVINKTICQFEGSFPKKVSRKMAHAKQTLKKEKRVKCTIIKWHIFLNPTGFIRMQQSIIFFFRVEFVEIRRKPKSIFS